VPGGRTLTAQAHLGCFHAAVAAMRTLTTYGAPRLFRASPDRPAQNPQKISAISVISAARR